MAASLRDIAQRARQMEDAASVMPMQQRRGALRRLQEHAWGRLLLKSLAVIASQANLEKILSLAARK
jgi:hypothetical protein